VLEIGCGTGANLIPMAYGLPQARFLGVDLASSAVAEGCRTADALGLANIELRVMDLAALDEGEFDYIIAHGVYSWVPEEVRDALLRVCGKLLAPRGVAFVSYNVYPGCHLRAMLREPLLFHVGDLQDPRQRMDEARTFIEWLRQAQGDTEFGHDLADALTRSEGAIYHDDMAEINVPVYFHQFMAQAAGHGLQFLGEANAFEMWAQGVTLPEEPLLREQYLDFARLRRFRRTLLCRAGVAVDREIAPERVAGLFASSPAHEVPAAQKGAVRFEGLAKSGAVTAHPLAISILRKLTEAWPRRLPVAKLAGEPDRMAAGEILLWGYHAGLVQLHVHAPEFVRPAGKRPVASPVAREYLRSGTRRVPTLHHEAADLEDDAAVRLIGLLDGTRDHALDRVAALPLLVA
jgi:SAM-dependent methyltransferase